VAKFGKSFGGNCKLNKAYIIGSTSFLGKHLAEELSQDYQVLTSPSYSKYKDYLSWEDQIIQDLLREKPDLIVIAGASQSKNDDKYAIEELVNSNCRLPSTVASTLLQTNREAKLIVFGSSWQYADSQEYRPFNLYAASKQAGYDLLEHYALHGLRICGVLLFDTYGPEDERNKLLNLLISAGSQNKQIALTFGEQEIDLVEIRDVCKGVRKCIEELATWDVANGLMKRGLGSGKAIKVKTLAGMVEGFFEAKNLFILGARGYREREVMRVFKGYIRPKGWKIRYSLREQLKRVRSK